MLHHRGSVIGLLIMVGLLILAGTAIHNAAWNQGFAMGRLSAGGEGAATLPYVYPGAPHAGFGSILAIGLIVLGLMLVFRRSVRYHFWRAAQQHGMPPWAAGPQAGQAGATEGQTGGPEGRQGFVPPWWRHWCGSAEGQRHEGPCGPWFWPGPMPPQHQAGAPQPPEKPAPSGDETAGTPQS